MEGRVILLEDFNTQSLEWNLHCGEMRDTVSLEALVGGQGLILNNEPEKTIRPTRRNTASIFDLTFTTLEIGALDTWIIDKELSTLSDHEEIVCDLANLDKTV